MRARPAVAAVLAALALPAGADEAPMEIRCLARHYAAAPARAASGWALALPDGKTIPLHRGGARSFAERLDDPDAADVFAIPYRPGAIRPVEEDDDDPGRLRIEPLLAATYGDRDLVRVPFFGARVRIHRRIAPAVARVAARLARRSDEDPRAFTRLAPFLRRLGGFHDRRIAGTTRKSAHAFGIAIDLDARLGDYWRWSRSGYANRVPQEIVDDFEAEGFAWGGRWFHFDTMHFEYRPELFDPDCRR